MFPKKIQEENIKTNSELIQTSIMKAAESFEDTYLIMLAAARDKLKNSKRRMIIDEIIDEENEHLTLLKG
ncbi:MAG: hypothetical protein JEZ04_21410 [Spirochaetales bacterium]|nr:hypothetical protein [Spirochaetales bacterium]